MVTIITQYKLRCKNIKSFLIKSIKKQKIALMHFTDKNNTILHANDGTDNAHNLRKILNTKWFNIKQ